MFIPPTAAGTARVLKPPAKNTAGGLFVPTIRVAPELFQKPEIGLAVSWRWAYAFIV
jgi:hypothetical protein